MTAAVDLLESMKNSRLAPGIIAYTSLLTGIPCVSIICDETPVDQVMLTMEN